MPAAQSLFAARLVVARPFSHLVPLSEDKQSCFFEVNFIEMGVNAHTLIKSSNLPCEQKGTLPTMTQARNRVSSTIHSSLASDPELAGLIAEFVAEMPLRVARLRRQLANQQWQALGYTVHQLKGAAGSYGFTPLTTMAQDLETLLTQHGELQDVQTLSQKLIGLCQRLSAMPMHDKKSTDD